MDYSDIENDLFLFEITKKQEILKKKVVKVSSLVVPTFMTVAVQTEARFKGSMASSFIPDWNCNPFDGKSLGCNRVRKEN